MNITVKELKEKIDHLMKNGRIKESDVVEIVPQDSEDPQYIGSSMDITNDAVDEPFLVIYTQKK